MIHTTKEYDKFSLINYNREVNRKHLNRLKISIKHKDLTKFKPVIVDKEFCVVDGQHTFVACKELGLPIHYMQLDNFRPAQLDDENVVSQRLLNVLE